MAYFEGRCGWRDLSVVLVAKVDALVVRLFGGVVWWCVVCLLDVLAGAL